MVFSVTAIVSAVCKGKTTYFSLNSVRNSYNLWLQINFSVLKNVWI